MYSQFTVHVAMFPSNKLHLSCPGHADLVYADTSTAAAKAILLTDLGLAGFEPGDSGSSAEPATIELLLSCLARLHANSYDYLASCPDQRARDILRDDLPLAGRGAGSEVRGGAGLS